MTNLAAQVAAALDARKAAQAAGPRTEADLARALGVSRVDLHRRLTGARPMPPEMAARIRAALPEVGRSWQAMAAEHGIPPEAVETFAHCARITIGTMRATVLDWHGRFLVCGPRATVAESSAYPSADAAIAAIVAWASDPDEIAWESMMRGIEGGAK